MQQQINQESSTHLIENNPVVPEIEDNPENQQAQYWWMNISTETWDIEEGEIGEPQTIPFLDFQSLSKDEKKDESVLNWLICYFKDIPHNPHFGQPIAPQEMAISLLDSENETINNETIEKAKKRISKVLKPCLNRMGIVMDPDVVLDTISYRRHGGRQMRAWMTQLDGLGRPLEKMVKNKYRHEVSNGERLPRELSAQHTFVHYFYRNRPGCVPTGPYTKGKEYEEGYVKAALQEDPEIGYDIKNISPFPDFHIEDEIVVYEATTKRITGLLKIVKIEKERITVQIEEVYDNPIFIERIKDKIFLQGIFIPFKLSLSDYKDIRKEIISNNPKYRNNYSKKYSEERLLEECFIDTSLLEDIKQTLVEKKCLILQGAPGVGKTYLAKRIAYAIMKEKNDYRIGFVQFHQNYTYEDFIIGYKPREGEGKKKDKGGFILKDGIFKAFCHKASIDPDNDYYFIIDEINRGNISKIFGEAFSLIEKEYRDQAITLAYSQKKFIIPKNVNIIGLMNTADRSLAMIDFALRRRFRFITLKPAFESETFDKRIKKKVNNAIFDKIIDAIVKLNQVIKEDHSLGEGFCIGHSYFCNIEKNKNNDCLRRIVEYEIIPMLQEYWFDNEGKYKEEAKKLRDILESE
ncbi:MAG: AAA family ATPase [Bacteroidaceae bacterium]|nr:AAA family ATPase [Bacteroidaceae bacterium]